MTKICKHIAEYIEIVRSEEYPVCREQLLLCDFVEKVFETEDIYVDEKQLEEYLKLQKYFPYELFPWEKFCFALHNCTYKRNGALRFPTLFIMVGRGAGKNGYLSFEDFCLLTPINGVKFYNIDICATSEDQARTSFDDIYNILEDDKNKNKLKRHFYWNKEKIINLKTRSELRFRTSNANTKDGGRPGKVDFDEKHAYADYKLINVFKTGLGKKRFPRTTEISTNGDVRDGPLDHDLARAEQILKGEIPDNGFLPFICRLDDKKEVDNPLNWHKANPSLRYDSTLQEEMEREYGDYKLDNIGNSAFMTKRMNIPFGNKEAEVTSWDNILATNRPIPDLTGCTCVFGIDYAKTTDFVSAGILFFKDGNWYWITHTWVCSNCNDLSRIKYPLKEAEEKGLLTFVNDVEISPDIPAEWLAQQAQKYRVVLGGIDLYRYTLLSKSLTTVGFTADKKTGKIKLIRPSNQMLVSPVITSAFENKKIIWGDNSLMRWYTNNAKQVLDTKGNVSYGKIEPKSRKTDGFMAFVAAMCCGVGLLDVKPSIPAEIKVYTY